MLVETMQMVACWLPAWGTPRGGIDALTRRMAHVRLPDRFLRRLSPVSDAWLLDHIARSNKNGDQP